MWLTRSRFSIPRNRIIILFCEKCHPIFLIVYSCENEVFFTKLYHRYTLLTNFWSNFYFSMKLHGGKVSRNNLGFSGRYDKLLFSTKRELIDKLCIFYGFKFMQVFQFFSNRTTDFTLHQKIHETSEKFSKFSRRLTIDWHNFYSSQKYINIFIKKNLINSSL